MQTLTIGRTKYKLSPSRNVGELQAKVSKITGKTKKSAIAKERRSYPNFYAGQSTDEYVKSFYMLNFRDTIGSFFEPLNCEPCTLYSGEDLHETMTDDDCAQECTTIAQESAPVAPAPVADAPAAAVAADCGTDAERFEAARVRILAPMLLERFGVSLPDNVPMSGTAELLRLGALARAAASDEIFGPNDATDTVLQRLLRNKPTPLPRVLYSDFIRSAGKREAPMMA